MRHNTVAAVIGLSLFLAGCAGTQFDWAHAKQVQAGMTESEIVALLGKPYMIKSQGEGQLWVWSQANGFTGQVRAVSFPMKDGRVVSTPNMSVFD